MEGVRDSAEGGLWREAERGLNYSRPALPAADLDLTLAHRARHDLTITTTTQIAKDHI